MTRHARPYSEVRATRIANAIVIGTVAAFVIGFLAGVSW